MELSAFSNSAMRETRDLKFDPRDMKEAGRDSSWPVAIKSKRTNTPWPTT